MKRRTFVQSAATAVLGLGLSSNAMARPFLSGTTGIHHWLRDLANATSAKRRSGASAAKDSFRALTTSLNTYFAKRGYAAADHPEFYFYHQEESSCFYSLKLRHARAGLDDVLVAVLARDADGEWRHTHTLTGYQIEALARAATALTAHPDLQQLLLPKYQPTGIPAHLGFSSSLADIHVKTQLSKGKAETSISIHENGALLFQDHFESRHCLTFKLVNA